MDLFDVLNLIGGLALFLFGMDTMGKALEKQAGGRLKIILEKLTSNPLKGLLLGAGVTAIIQSSSATTVMVVGFVNSGLMKLYQAIGVIMGANIGTTITAWILSLTAIESDNFFLQLLKPSSFTPVLAAIGICLLMFSKKEKRHNIGTILLGFAVLITGMDIMTSAVEPLADMPEFTNILLMFRNPIFGVLAGAIFTAAIQSSSASVGILQALSGTGVITYGTAIPIIMGQNIGTCITALLASIGTSKNAKRVAAVHFSFNIIGTTLFLSLFYILNAVLEFSFVDTPVNAASIAVIHSLFNICTTAVLLPFTKQLEKLACFIVKDSKEDEEFDLLDDRLMVTPSMAVYRSHQVADKMAQLAKKTLFDGMRCLDDRDEKLTESVEENEERIDQFEDKLGTYLVRLGNKDLNEEDNREAGRILHCIGDFERIGDHALNLKETAEEMRDKHIRFSVDGKAELDVMGAAVREILDMAVEVFLNNDTQLAAEVEPLEQVIDYLQNEIKNRHIERLKRGECTTELGFVFQDVLTNYERVADHCSNIAICIIESAKDCMSMHGYLNDLKDSHDEFFEKRVAFYMEKYALH